jgi:hypothetical protein
MPVIIIELFLVLGGVTAFAWWQFRDLAQEKKKTEARRAREAAEAAAQAASPSAPAEAAPQEAPAQRPRGSDHAA